MQPASSMPWRASSTECRPGRRRWSSAAQVVADIVIGLELKWNRVLSIDMLALFRHRR